MQVAGLNPGPVILDILFHITMTPASVKVIVLHLFIYLIKGPAIMVIPVDRTHNSGSMASARAMNEKLACFRVINELQKLVNLRILGIRRVRHWDIDIV